MRIEMVLVIWASLLLMVQMNAPMANLSVMASLSAEQPPIQMTAMGDFIGMVMPQI